MRKVLPEMRGTRGEKHFRLFILPAIILLSLFCFIQTGTASDELSNDDCIKCHRNTALLVKDNGGKHKTAVTCLTCHPGHPPMVSKSKIIPVCSECHAGKPHYALKGCNTCHTNPHAPLKMKLAANLTAPCVSCHEQQGKELKQNVSRHSKLFCTTCHKAHKQIPSCLDCHQGHTADMVNKDCMICHPAHRPLVIAYGQDIPNKYCAACHKGASNALIKSETRHSKLACVFCHKDRHKYVPKCESCHGTPHPAVLIAKFPKCIMCHTGAHSLGKEVKK